jgi:methylthioribose-1-phosphate isomerase
VLRALDQTRLPEAEVELELSDGAAVAEAIRRLAIRGAPLIGVAAAYGLAMEVISEPTATHARSAAALLRSARPTAVNLSYAVDRVLEAALAAPPEELAAAALSEAQRVHADELAASAAMASHGADHLGPDVRRVLTHCNTGALAAPGYGTALGVIAELYRRGSLAGVLATESRPLLQGARLTVWELSRLGIPHELCVDSAAAGLLAGGGADAVVLGCDRVAANGDVANKVGTYMLALAARAAGIPFVVAGPCSTIDPGCPDGGSILIEERDADEVRTVRGARVTVDGTAVRNPAFDVTPASLVSALVTDRGVVSPVDGPGIRALLAVA